MQLLSHRINTRSILAVFAALLIVVLLATVVGVQLLFQKPTGEPDVFIGVDVGYGDANAVYTIANAVSGYDNLIIIGSLEVTSNTTELINVCNYLYQKGFYFIVYVGFAELGVFPPQGPDSTFFQMAISHWVQSF